MAILSGGRQSNATRIWLVVVLVACIHLICYRAASPLRRQAALSSPLSPSGSGAAAGLLKRALFRESEEPAEDAGGALIDWKSIYEGATSQQRPFLFAGMILWLMFLFAFVGITASDFFCPNLSTIASRLGMSESVAGVTFLAFSNGSPDVFSTFAALSQGSGSLAIGELIGAASFIVSVVAGTMCLIKPFRVSKHTFLRDVGFFTIAVAFTLGILYDSHIHLWEAFGMVGLYLIYVFVVAVGSWWMARKEKREALIRAARDEYAEEARGYTDEVEEGLLPHSAHESGRSTPHSHHSTTATSTYPFPSPTTSAPFSPAIGHPHMHQSLDEDSFFAAAERGTPVTLTRSRSGSLARPLVRRAKTRSTVRPSLLGAIEFRDVVNSLREDSSARTLAVFGGLGDEQHTHATLVGAEGTLAPHLTGRQRALSHSGALTLGGLAGAAVDEDGSATRPPLAKGATEGARRTTWTAPPQDGSGLGDLRGPWSGAEDEEEEEGGRRSPLIDLSEGVENPWHSTRSRSASRSSLHIDIPPSSAASTRMRSAPPSIRRTASGQSLDEDGKRIRKVPSILLTSASGDESLVQSSSVIPPGAFAVVTHRRGYRIARAVFLALFPSLQDFRDKSWVGRATAILCVPAILVLNLTLPVVDSEADDCASLEEKEARAEGVEAYRDYDSDDEDQQGPREGILVDTDDFTRTPPHHDHRSQSHLNRHNREEAARALHGQVIPHAETVDGVEVPSPWETIPAHTPMGEEGHDDIRQSFARFSIASENGTANHVRSSTADTEESVKSEGQASPPNLEVHANVLTRWLTAVQCTLGPVFCVTALLIDELKWWYPLAALAGGLTLGSFAFYIFEHPTHPGRIVLCFVGFFVAMVWILMIVNEVVGVLQTIGHIFGLSDAILGLTVFAVGNSLGDLVANATVARMGFPSMAIAACFGGPMLNILLGIGLSGSYMVIINDYEPLHVKMGRTLIVSGVGLLVILLSTLVLVPLNGFWMNKKLGAGLILAYTCVLSINVAVEIWL